MAGPFLTTFPRRRRVLAIPLFFLLIWALLPIESFNPPRALLLSVTTTLAGKSGDDILQFIDPLIGTANGGVFVAIAARRNFLWYRDMRLTRLKKAMSSLAQPCPMVSANMHSESLPPGTPNE